MTFSKESTATPCIELSTGPMMIAHNWIRRKSHLKLWNDQSSHTTSEQINSWYDSSKLTKQASKTLEKKTFETLLTYLETFDRWVPLYKYLSFWSRFADQFSIKFYQKIWRFFNVNFPELLWDFQLINYVLEVVESRNVHYQILTAMYNLFVIAALHWLNWFRKLKARDSWSF